MAEKILKWLSSTTALYTSMGTLVAMLVLGWNLRAATEKLPLRVGDLEKRVQHVDERDSTGIAELQRMYNLHDVKLTFDVRQTNRIFCVLKYPNSGLNQAACAREEDLKTGVAEARDGSH